MKRRSLSGQRRGRSLSYENPFARIELRDGQLQLARLGRRSTRAVGLDGENLDEIAGPEFHELNGDQIPLCHGDCGTQTVFWGRVGRSQYALNLKLPISHLAGKPTPMSDSFGIVTPPAARICESHCIDCDGRPVDYLEGQEVPGMPGWADFARASATSSGVVSGLGVMGSSGMLQAERATKSRNQQTQSIRFMNPPFSMARADLRM